MALNPSRCGTASGPKTCLAATPRKTFYDAWKRDLRPLSDEAVTPATSVTEGRK